MLDHPPLLPHSACSLSNVAVVTLLSISEARWNDEIISRSNNAEKIGVQ